MKELNTYLEGLLSGSKSGTNSATIDSIIDYMQSDKLLTTHGNYECVHDNDTINIIADYQGVVNMSLGELEEYANTTLIPKSNIRKIHSNIEFRTGYSNQLSFDQNITLSSDSLIEIYSQYRKTIEGLNLESLRVELMGNTTLKGSNINAHIIFLVDKSKTIQCDLKSDYIFICSSFEKSKIKLLSNLGFVKNDGSSRLNFIKQDDSNKPLIDIDPIKVLDLKRWTGDTIVITERWDNMAMSGCALITKDKLTLTVSDATNIFEMKNGWWVGLYDRMPRDYARSI